MAKLCRKSTKQILLLKCVIIRYRVLGRFVLSQNSESVNKKKLRPGSAFCRSVPEFFFYAMPKSFSCSFQEKGKLVSSFVRESDHGALPAKMASTMGGASSVSLRKRRT